MFNLFCLTDAARRITKNQLRGGLVEKLASRQEEDINTFVTFTKSDAVQNGLRRYLEMLKAKQNAAKKK